MEYEDAIRKLVDLGVGIASISKEKLTETARQIADVTKLDRVEARQLIDDLVERGQQSRIEMQQMIQEQVQKSVQRLGWNEKNESLQSEIFALRGTVGRLTERVRVLESRLEQRLSDTLQSDED